MHEEHLAADFVGAMNRDDVRMRQPRGRPRLAQEALANVGSSGEMRRQRLDRDHPVEPQVARQVHDAHAAAADLALDLVLPGKRAWRRPSVVGRRESRHREKR